MSDEVKMAAERLQNGFNYAQCPDHWRECNDARLLAAAYLAENDQTPIDEAFLRSVGAEITEHYSSLPAGDDLELRFRDDRFWLVEGPRDETPDCVLVMRPVSTRGDLCRLCAALGIALPKPAAQRQEQP